MNTLTDKINTWLNSHSDLSERDKALLKRATAVFENNLFESENSTWGSYRGILPSPGQYNGVWNWDSAFHALAVSYFDAELAYEQFEIFFDFQGDDGIFPDVIYNDGRIKDNYSKPPVFPWAFVEVYKRCPKPEILNKAYDCYCKNLSFWNNNRMDKQCGLYYYDARWVDGDHPTHQKWESGMDNSPRWDDGVNQWLAVDLNGYMAMFYDSLAQMAEWLNHPGDAEKWRVCSAELKNKVNTMLWCSEKQCFVDRNRFNGEFSDTITSASFVPLFAGCADEEHARLMNEAANDKEMFSPSMPTVAYSCTTFSATDYWRGPVWLNLAYFASEGLRKYGYTDTAEAIKEHILNDAYNEKRDIFEYYDARTGKGLGAKSFGWSAAFIIEYIMQGRGYRAGD